MSDREGRLDGDRLFYRAWNHTAPLGHVVIVHGYAEHSGRYEHVGDRLRDAGFTSWAIDHRGHGQSVGDRGDIESIEATVSDLDLLMDLVDEEARGASVFMLGHSMGGMIATAYAEEHQPRLAGLALSGPALVVPPEVIALADMDEIPDLGLADAVSSDPAVVRAYKEDPLNHLGPPPRRFLLAMRDVEQVRRRFAELTLPILVMHGSADALASPRALSDVVAGVASQDVTAKLWPGLYHEIFNEPRQADVLDFLVHWLNEHLR